MSDDRIALCALLEKSSDADLLREMPAPVYCVAVTPERRRAAGGMNAPAALDALLRC